MQANFDQWADRPDLEDQHPRWTLLVPRNSMRVGGIALADKVTGAYVHWVKDRGRKGADAPCHGDRCPWCPANGLKWKGFLPVYLPKSQKIGVLQISENAYREMVATIGDMENLRGLYVLLYKGKNRANAPVNFDSQRMGKFLGQELHVPSIDVKPYLLRLWQYRQRTKVYKEMYDNLERQNEGAFNEVPY